MPKTGDTPKPGRVRGADRSSRNAALAEVRGFGFNPGGLRMLAHIPKGLPPGAALVVALHGCTQSAGPYARAAGWIALADRLGFALLAPEQNAANNPNRCFNWFQPHDIARDAGEAASIHAMTQHMVRTHGLDPERVFITGLSAGGAMAAVLLATYPETYAAGAVVAGLPFGLAGNVQEAFAAMQGGRRLGGAELGALVDQAAPASPRIPRLTIWQGDADRTVAAANASALARQWAAVHQLPEAPDEVRSRAGLIRSVWRDADGEVLIEMNLVAGLGHGVPLAAGGDDPIGEPAPYMLEAGISSSLEIARFWGLSAPETAAEAEAWSVGAPLPDAPTRRATGLGEGVMAAVSPHVSEDVRKVIANALGAAGLMR